jgi:hypothetical protein
MLYSEIIAVCSEIHTKHINTLCGQSPEYLNVTAGGIQSIHWTLKVKLNIISASILYVTGVATSKTNRLSRFRAIIIVYSENYRKHINKLYGKNVDPCIKTDGTHS